MEHASIQCLRCAQEKLYVSADILELVQHLGNETNMAPAICLTDQIKPHVLGADISGTWLD